MIISTDTLIGRMDVQLILSAKVSITNATVKLWRWPVDSITVILGVNRPSLAILLNMLLVPFWSDVAFVLVRCEYGCLTILSNARKLLVRTSSCTSIAYQVSGRRGMDGCRKGGGGGPESKQLFRTQRSWNGLEIGYYHNTRLWSAVADVRVCRVDWVTSLKYCRVIICT